MEVQGAVYKTGDIIEVNSTSFPYATHYGIYFIKEDVPYIAHNTMATGGIEIEPFADFIKGRSTLKVIRNVSHMTDEQIYERALEIKKKKEYSLFKYSCESFVREMCDCFIGIDQRIIFWWGVSFVGVAILVVISIIRDRKK